MRKTTRGLLILILAVLILPFLFACGETDGFDIETYGPTFYSEWMSYIKAEARLAEIAIPGTHDSGTYGIGRDSDFLCYLAETQSGDFRSQLDAGARYFDIRVNRGTEYGSDGSVVDKNALKLFHGIVNSGMTFRDACLQIKGFLDAFPSEFLILDFQDVSLDAAEEVLSFLDNLLDAGKTALKAGKNLNELTLNDIRSAGARLIVMWNGYSVEKRDYLYGRDANLISYYQQINHLKGPDYLIGTGLPEEFGRREEGKLFVLQAQLTMPVLETNPEYVYYSSLKETESDLNLKMNSYIRGLKDRSELLTKINVVMRDYFNEDKEKADSALSLNLAKGLVIGKAQKFFAAMTSYPL